MSFAVLNIPISPLRKEANNRSEMVSQVLFGEHFSILELQQNWTKIRLLNDEYEGWIDSKGYQEISASEFGVFKKSKTHLTSSLFSIIFNEEEKCYLPLGSCLPHFINGTFKIGETVFNFDTLPSPYEFETNLFEKTAKLFLNAPYLWGGKSIFGVDCSGFTQLVFAQFGVQLFRDAHLQAIQGEMVGFVSEARLGDLAFFENLDGHIIHVGIVLPDFTIIHAHGKVRIDVLDDMGIFNKKTGKHSHRLRIIKRFF
jgi:hypothetical protein